MAILNAAGEVFTQRPFAQAKVSDVLDLLTVGKGAVYFHFKNKLELGRAVLLEGREQLQAVAVESLAGKGHPRDKLLLLTYRVASLIAESPVVAGLFRLSMQSGHEFPGIVIDPYAVWQPMVHTLLAAAESDGHLQSGVNVDELTWTIISSFMGSKEILGYQGSLNALPDRVNDSLSALLALAFK